MYKVLGTQVKIINYFLIGIIIIYYGVLHSVQYLSYLRRVNDFFFRAY